MEINTQRKNQFDYQTIQKIGRGALIAGAGGAAVYILGEAGKIDAGAMTGLVAFAVPFLINLIKEYIKGETVDE